MLTTIVSFSATDPTLSPGETLRVEANLQSNANVASVQFYLDNGDGQFNANTDQLIGTDSSATGGWKATVQTAGPYNILPIGDSITAARAPQVSYRYPLWFELNGDDYDFDFIGSENGPSSIPSNIDADHEGHWGFRADQILAQLPSWVNNTDPDIALIHIGTNDLFQGQSNASTLNEIEQIIDVLREENPDVAVLVSLLIPSNFPSNALIDSFNAELPSRVQQWNTQDSPVVLVDLNTPINAVTHLYDGVHPNATGESIMASVWSQAIVEVAPLANPAANFTNGSHTLFAVATNTGGATGSPVSTQITISTPSSFNGTALLGINEAEELWIARSNGTTLETTFAGTWPAGIDFTHFASGDVNGDGFEDMVGRQVNGEVWVALSNGNGGFQFEEWGELTNAIPWLEFFVADFNGDGRDDLAGRVGTDGSWWMSLSTGSGFQMQTSRWSQFPETIGWDFVVGDFTGDGRHDITGRARTNGTWWTAVSTGTSFANQYWGHWSKSYVWNDIVVGDFNGDGRDDIAGRRDNRSWWIGASNGTNFNSYFAGNWTQSVDWQNVMVGDFDNNGRDDIAGLGNGQWWIAMSTPASQYFQNQFWGSWPTYTNWHDVQAIDINADGKDDIIGRADNGEWWSYVAQPSNTFSAVRAARWSALARWDHITTGRFG